MLPIVAAILCVAATVYSATSENESTPFARHPALSADGSRLAISYLGDIWILRVEGGNATRLTIHPSYEHHPRWSPNGEWIAFSGGREGDDDVYVMPSNGGTPRQLTFLDTDDLVSDWSPDGNRIVFSARREDRYPDHEMLYTVSSEGGEPVAITEAYGSEATMDDSVKRLLMTRQGSQWWRKGYLSSGSPQVWQFDLIAKTFAPITDTTDHQTGDDFRQAASRWPMWSPDGALTVASERDGTYNLWRRSISGQWKQLTQYKGDGVRFPSSARTADVVAYEQGTDIFLLKVGQAPQKVTVNAFGDDLGSAPILRNFNDHAGKLVFSPDGKQMFLEVRGETVASRIVGDEDKAARGRANVLSRDNPARESEFTVSPGGDSLVVVSDRWGNRDLLMVTANDPLTAELSKALSVNWRPLVATQAEEFAPQFSPDGNSIAFRRGLGDLVIQDLEMGGERVLLSGWSLLQYAWSPDSKWIAFTREDNEFNSDIFVIPAQGGAAVNISRHPDEDEQPVWSADGSKLAFRSRRRDNNWDIYVVQLKLADYQKSAADRAEEIRAKAASKKDKKDEDGDKKKEKPSDKEPVKVTIDTTNIYERLQPVTKLNGEESLPVFSPDGEKIAFTSNHEGENDIYIIKWNGEGIKRLTNGAANPSMIDFETSGKRVRYLDGTGRVKSVDADGGSAKDHPFDAKILVKPEEERLQKFDEVWRGLNLRFYDSNFHGKDWAELREKYRDWAAVASCEDDFGDVVRIMMGELNASHLGYNSAPLGNEKTVGRLGLDLEVEDGWRVNNVLANGPTDRVNSKVLPGDKILSIAGTTLTPTIPIDSLLRDQVGQRVELVIKRGKDEKRLVVKPINRNELGDLRYDEWVLSRRQLVDSLSKGRIGYLHIRGMGEESLARFETELYSVGYGKDGLVIDVRNNGGGWTTDWLLAMLQVKRHGITYPRDGGPGYPQDRLPLYSWTKPIVTLCNEHSFSNAEIFSHSIKTLKRGTVVGVPTPGGVISTGGDGLVDGSYYRIPLRGWYIGDSMTRDPLRNMEGNGAVPDIIVPLQPDETTPATDRQLIEAVKVISSQLGAAKN